MKKYINIIFNIILSLVSGAGVTNIAGDNTKLADYTPLVYSGFLGGMGADEIIDTKYSNGYLYVLGTGSANVTVTPGAFSDKNNGGKDIFVYKYRIVNNIPAELVYATMYGGSGDDIAVSLDIDEAGRLYITGSTNSADLPLGVNALDTGYNGGGDGFAIVFAPEAENNYRLVFATFLGGSGNDMPSDMAIADNKLSLIGTTTSNDFPITSGAFNENPNGEDEVFATVLDISNFNDVSIVYSTYFGGDKSETATSLVVTESGEIIIAGTTFSDDLIISHNSYSGHYNYGSRDGFVAVIRPGSSGVNDLAYSSYFGGSGNDYVSSATVNTNGKIVIAGYTDSGDLPVTTDAVYNSLKGKFDLFVSVFDIELDNEASLVYSTYIGGSANDILHCAIAGTQGDICLAGMTESFNFPTINGSYDRTYNGLKDVFFLQINIEENPEKSLSYSTYIGSNKNESALTLCAMPNERYCIAGTSDSRLYPVTENALDKEFDSETDGILSVLYLIPLKITSVSSQSLCWGDSLFIEYIAGEYNNNNSFTFELSDSIGSFNSPVILGSLSSSQSGVFGCRIPNNIPYSNKYRIRIRSTNPYNVYYSDSNYVTIIPLPKVSLLFKNDICYSAPPLELLGGEPAGGIYSGNGVVGGWFYPTMAGTGASKVFYTVENENGCKNTAELTINVRDLPPTPIITNIGGILESSIPFGNSWYLDGKPIAGANGKTISPVQFGNYTVVATNAWGCSSFPSDPYIYNTINNKPLFSLGSIPLYASPGQIVQVPLILENANIIKQFGVKKVIAKLTFNSTILEPWYDTPQGYVRDGQRIIETEIDIEQQQGKVSKDIYLRATLGNDTATVIEFDNVTSDKGDFAYTAQPVTFNLLGVCREGGLRLTGAFGRTELVPPVPNPAGAICNFEFEVVEKGIVQLSLINITGETAANLIDQYMEPGRRMIRQNLSEIPAGSYFLVLKTPGKVRVQRMSIVK